MVLATVMGGDPGTVFMAVVIVIRCLRICFFPLSVLLIIPTV